MADPNKSYGVGGGSGRFRTLIIFIVGLVIVVSLMAYVYYARQVKSGGLVTGADITKAPSIASVPGEATSAEYARSLQKENIQQAEVAAQTGASAIATISRESFKGSSEFEEGGGSKPGCSAVELQRARESGVKASEIKCKGCSAKELRAAGYNAADLAAAGYSAADLRAAGFTAEELRDAGFSAAELKSAGYRADELRKAGYLASELAVAGYTRADLEAAGYTPDEIAQSGVGMKERPHGCGKEELTNAKRQGVHAVELRSCGAAALRAAGFTAAELRMAGFSAKELKAAGFTGKDLKGSGFTAGELLRAGYNVGDLRAAGFTAKQLRAAGFSPEQMRAAGYAPDELRAAGYTDGDLKRAGYTKEELENFACSAQGLKQARADNVSTAALAAKGCTADQLRAAGFSDAEIATAATSAAGAGQKNTCTADFLKQARAQNAPPAQLASNGCTADQLRAAGYTEADIAAVASIAASQKNAAACTPDFLKQAKAQNVSPSVLTRLGCPPEQMIAVGYSAAEIANPCGPEALKNDQARGLTPEQMIAKGCTEGQLHAAGMPATAIELAAVAGESRIEAMQRQREARLTADERRDQLERARQAMENQANSLFETWTPPAPQVMIVAPEVEKKKEAAQEVRTSEKKLGPGEKPGGVVGGKLAGGTIIKAGTVMYGVIDTGVNSDEKSPILATIVTGPLKSSKLVGEFTTVNDKVVLNFNVLNAPMFESSVPLKAVAIDNETARTALASNVDYHYWLRYGGLFASSFLSGLGQAISSSGQQSSSGAGGLIVTNATLTTAQKLGVALGRVGTEYAAQLGQTFTTPPTVTVEAGTSIGILFMSDVTLPGKL